MTITAMSTEKLKQGDFYHLITKRGRFNKNQEIMVTWRYRD